MSHFSVLILGADPELQLDPYAELSAIDGPAAENYRAVFQVEVLKADFATFGVRRLGHGLVGDVGIGLQDAAEVLQ